MGMLNEADKQLDEEEYSWGLYEKSLKTIDRVKEDVDYINEAIDKRAEITEEDKSSLRNKMEMLELQVKQCSNKLRIKRLEDLNRRKDERCQNLTSELNQKAEFCEELSEKLREVELAREEQEERKIPLSDQMIVRVLGTDDARPPLLLFEEDYISYKRFCRKIQRRFALEPDSFLLTYTAENGETKMLDSPKTFEDAFQTAKPRILFDGPVLALQVRLELRQDNNVEEPSSNEGDKSGFVEVPASDPPNTTTQDTATSDAAPQNPVAPEQPNEG
ncbi:hypothetical protein EC973_001809 [Apophysomyces ossiformis]|uniref:Uncharacterized protein n=1 Tax=Apophysomyces ossiformis TaxID=679940 RepID=A0A8H7EP25_9FUNG|nr:hypothetical protein EC973_001809 [Apophysomyces ossiformis]